MGGMYKSAVLAHYKGSQSAVARALKITRASVHNWPELIPEQSAYRLQSITRGKLKVDANAYDVAKGRVAPRVSEVHAS